MHQSSANSSEPDTVLDFTAREISSSEESVLIPCWMYDVIYESFEDPMSLNILEEAVLKMMSAVKGNIQNASVNLCLDKDLVSFIVRKLHFLGRLDNSNIPYSSKENKETKSRIRIFRFFVEAVTGKALILPFFSFEKGLQTKNVVSFENSFVTLEDNQKAYCIPGEKNPPIKTPNRQTVREQMQEYLKIIQYKRLSHINRCDEKVIRRILDVNAKVCDGPRLVNLMVFCNVDRVIGEINLSDPTGEFLMVEFTSAVQRKLEKIDYFKYLKKRYETDFLEKGWLPDNEDSACDDKVNYHLKKASENYSCMIRTLTSNYDFHLRKRQRELLFANLYRAFEYALLDLYRKYISGKDEPVRLLNTKEEIWSYLRNCAEKLGMELSDCECNFMKLTENRLNAIFEGADPDLQTLLVMCFGQASYAIKHPFKDMADDFHSFILYLQELKQYRDKSMHSRGLEDVLPDDLEKMFNSGQNWLKRLRPFNFQSKEDGLASRKMSSEVLFVEENIRYKAMLELRTCFGALFCASAPNELRESLITMLAQYGIQKYLGKSSNYSKQCEFINLIYRCFELLFENVSSDKYPSEILNLSESEFRNVLSDKHLSPEKGSAVATCKYEMIRRCLLRKGGSLQSELCAFWFRSDKEKLERFLFWSSNNGYDLIQFIEKVVKLRGHGGSEGLMHSDELSKMKKEALVLMKRIWQHFG